MKSVNFLEKKFSMTKKKTFKNFFLKIYFKKIFAPPIFVTQIFAPPNIYDKSTPLRSMVNVPKFHRLDIIFMGLGHFPPGHFPPDFSPRRKMLITFLKYKLE